MNHTWRIWLTVAAWLLVLTAVFACEPSDDDDDEEGDDNDTTDDDDDDNDDDDNDNDDDDNDDDDNDTPNIPGACYDVADWLINTCQTTLPDLEGNPVDEAGLAEWCALSVSLFTTERTASPFWDCMGDCALIEFCDEDCFSCCVDPAAPGTTCGDTVNDIYACNVVWVFEGTPYWIPEMDMQAACEYTLLDWPWDCYADCIPGGCDAMLDCLNACGG